MPAKKKAPAKRGAAAKVAAPKALQVQLWDAADRMRGTVPPPDYVHTFRHDLLTAHSRN